MTAEIARPRVFAHIQRVTPEEKEAAMPKKTHCKHGHPLSGENLGKKSSGKTYCRECQRIAARKSLAEANGKEPGPGRVRRAATAEARGITIRCGSAEAVCATVEDAAALLRLMGAGA